MSKKIIKEFNTVDSSSYYSRHKPTKQLCIKDFVSKKSDINIIYDVGCNGGEISIPLLEIGKKVLGIDLATDLKFPDGFEFKKMDIVNDEYIHFNDCTLFLSLYHHIFGKYGMEIADELFMKLLLRSKYLIFDTGNLSEKQRLHLPWMEEQKTHFKTEKDLLDHFNIPYEQIGDWSCGGGKRSVVVFSNENIPFKVVNEYRRKLIGGKDTKLYEINETSGLYDGVKFTKLEHNGKIYFGKDRVNGNEIELNNITKIYNDNKINTDNLIDFMGQSNKYGLIFEWINITKTIQSNVEFIFDDMTLKDVQKVEVDGKIKYIDFER